MNKKTITVGNPFQKNYTYTLSEPAGKNFDPRFKPELTPKEMLELGVFGGKYLLADEGEYPKDWFMSAKLSIKKDAKINYFKINASQPLEVWQAKGWIYKDDPRGWFEWYSRYYMGRRIIDEDERQIKRWYAMRRHASAVANNCKVGDLFCRPRQRQALLHWAYDSRKI